MGLTLPMKVEDELVLVLPLASVTDSTLQVLPEGIPYPVVADGTDAAVGVVVIVQVVLSVVPCLMHQIPCRVTVIIRILRTVIFPRPQARLIIGIRYHLAPVL